jgi:Ser/Thr protein kinase RdoA (MazF antagonist)
MLNKSVLIENDIIMIFDKIYNIKKINNIENIFGGRASIYCITIDNIRFVLKEYQNNYPMDKIINEYQLCDFLNKNEISTSKFLKTVEGNMCYEHKGHYITVQEFINGFTAKQFQAPKWLLLESGKLLGKINQKLEKYPMDIYEFKANWFTNFDINKKLSNYSKYIILAKEMDNEYSEQIIIDCEFKMQMLKKINDFEINYKNYTYVNSHGDYSILQLLCENDYINAVIDFASACNLPVNWEIIRSFTLASEKCKENVIEINLLIEYLEKYLSCFSINSTDIYEIFRIYISIIA